MLTANFLKKPLNHANLIGKPMLFADMPKAQVKDSDSGAYIMYNPMTENWFIFGQTDKATPYVFDKISVAIRMLLIVDHYNLTGERKSFAKGKVSDLELIG